MDQGVDPAGRECIIPSPSYQSQQHHSHRGTALGRSCRMKNPTPSFKLWNRVQWESKWPPLTPMGETEGLPWKRGLIPSMTVIFLASNAQASPKCPVQTVHGTTTKIFCSWMWLWETQGRDEICPSTNELGQGWGAHGSGTMGCDTRVTVMMGETQNKNFGHGNLHYQCEQPAFLLHLRML